jgi:hypothetical protein
MKYEFEQTKKDELANITWKGSIINEIQTLEPVLHKRILI